MENYDKYLLFIKNHEHNPLPVETFDEQWAPDGPRVRGELEEFGLIEIQAEGIVRVPLSMRTAP